MDILKKDDFMEKSNLAILSTKEFLNYVLKPTGTEDFYIACINMNGEFNQTKFSNIDSIIQWSKENQDKNQYFGVSTRKQNNTDFKKDSCKSLNCLWLDIDFKMEGNSSPNDVLKRIENFQIKPNIIVETGNGFHIYWLLLNPIELNQNSISFVESLLKGMCLELNGDFGPTQIATLMRLPESKNWKDSNQPKPCKIFKFNKGSLYGIEDFLKFKFDETSIKTPNVNCSKEIVSDEQINEKFKKLDREFQNQLLKNGSKDRSKYEFGLIIRLLKVGWSPEEIRHIALIPKFKEGLGKKTQEEGREDYLELTIERAKNTLINEEFAFDNDKPEFLRNIESKVDPNFLDQVYVHENKYYYHITNKFCRCLSKEEFHKRLRIEFTCDNDKGGKKRDQKQVNYLEKLHQEKIIKEFVIKIYPNSESKITINKLKGDGSFRITCTVSLLAHLKNLQVKYEGIEVSEKLKNFLESNYHEVLDVYKASIYRKFCGHKKSKVWYHCVSNHGKTFFFNIEGLSLMFQHEFNEEKLKGNEPQELMVYSFLFIDEVTRFQKELKNDSVLYRLLYGGTRKFDLPLVLLASANPIGDLEGGIDEQIKNRVSKIIPKPVILDIALKDIGETPQSIRKPFEKFIIELLIKEIEEISKAENFELEAEKRFKEFLIKYDNNLEVTDFKQLIIEEVQDILNETKIDTNGNFTGFNNYSVVGSALIVFCPTSKRIFLNKPFEFLRTIIYPRIGNKKFGFERSFPNNERLAEAFGSKYQINKVGGKSIRSIELFYKFENGSIVLIDSMARV